MADDARRERAPGHQQMDRSNDPEITRAMDAAAPEIAMLSRRQRLTGSAVGVGSVGFDESGAFDVGAGEAVEPDEPAEGWTSAGTGPRRPGLESSQEETQAMTDQTRPTPAEDPSFETDTVQADRAREQGLGLGERELKAQRDPGGVRTANEDADVEGGVDSSDEEQGSSASDA